MHLPTWFSAAAALLSTRDYHPAGSPGPNTALAPRGGSHPAVPGMPAVAASLARRVTARHNDPPAPGPDEEGGDGPITLGGPATTDLEPDSPPPSSPPPEEPAEPEENETFVIGDLVVVRQPEARGGAFQVATFSLGGAGITCTGRGVGSEGKPNACEDPSYLFWFDVEDSGVLHVAHNFEDG